MPVIPALILAAGESRRMGGRPKALLWLPPDDNTFLGRIVDTLRSASLEEIVVVTGAHHEEIAAEVHRRRLPVLLVENRRHAAGQLSSLLAGLAAVERPEVQAVMVTLVDVPLVSRATVEGVLSAYRSTGAPIVRPVSGDRHGHPVIFDRSLFRALENADPNVGARAVLRDFEAAILDVPVEDEGALVDIDTPADYDRYASGLAEKDRLPPGGLPPGGG
jgi:molybdenum cofactor cytidylyltransferase